MINPRSRSLEWITEVAQKMGVRDKALMEKTIRAFSLLEALARSGCPFLFKGGSSLMLHLNTSKRLSIDIDIICPPGTVIEDYLGKYAEEYGFGKVELVERISRTDVPKKHAKFYYEVKPILAMAAKIRSCSMFSLRKHTTPKLFLYPYKARYFLPRNLWLW